MDTRLLTFKSHLGNLELSLLTLMAITASEVKLTKLGDGIEPKRLQLSRCNSIKIGSLFNTSTH